VRVLNEAGAEWGVVCQRYEIRDITPPETTEVAMRKHIS